MKKTINQILVVLAGIFLVLEEWLWKVCYPTMLRLADHPIIHRLEEAIAKQKGLEALSAFLLPIIALIPFKFAALFVLAHGHIFLGGLVLILAKIVGAGVTARIYTLTKSELLKIDRFVYWQNRFFAFSAMIHARLDEIPAWGRFLQNIEVTKAKARAWIAERQTHPTAQKALARFQAAKRWVKRNKAPSDV